MDNPSRQEDTYGDHWYIRYPVGAALIYGGWRIFIYTQSHPIRVRPDFGVTGEIFESAVNWALPAISVVLGAHMMKEIWFLVCAAGFLFYGFDYVSSIPARIKTAYEQTTIKEIALSFLLAITYYSYFILSELEKIRRLMEKINANR